MEREASILKAFAIKGEGGGQVLEGDAISKTIKADQLAWVHLDGNHPDTKTWLEREVSYLDNLIIEALLEQNTRPRMIEYDQGALLILRGVNLNEDAEPEDMISIRLWIDASRIISVRLRPLKAVQDLWKKLENGAGPKNSGEFIGALSGRLFERMEPVFTDLDARLDDIEEEVMECPDKHLRAAITDIRKQAIIFRRYIAPQKDAIAQLRNSDLPWLEQNHKRKLQENLDRVTRYVEDLDTIRERAQIVKDELANALADKMNKNMYVLTIVAAIFLPLGFLTGLLGINVGGIPGAEYDGAFFVFSGILLSIVAVQILTFKLLKWF
ncbi:MAG: zinc transporter ZntB [Alphaproteobacteria bacterium]